MDIKMQGMVFSRDICGLKHRLSITRTFNDNTALQLTSEAVAGPSASIPRRIVTPAGLAMSAPPPYGNH
jgi:hypothetical protein